MFRELKNDIEIYRKNKLKNTYYEKNERSKKWVIKLESTRQLLN